MPLVLSYLRAQCKEPSTTRRYCHNSYSRNCFSACEKEASLTISGQSSIFWKWKPEFAITANLTEFWLSNPNDNNPWISIQMPKINEVIEVEVKDHQDSTLDVYQRYQNVEVFVGNSSDIKEPKSSCGVQSYEGSTTYRYELHFFKYDSII